MTGPACTIAYYYVSVPNNLTESPTLHLVYGFFSRLLYGVTTRRFSRFAHAARIRCNYGTCTCKTFVVGQLATADRLLAQRHLIPLTVLRYTADLAAPDPGQFLNTCTNPNSCSTSTYIVNVPLSYYCCLRRGRIIAVIPHRLL